MGIVRVLISALQRLLLNLPALLLTVGSAQAVITANTASPAQGEPSETSPAWLYLNPLLHLLSLFNN